MKFQVKSYSIEEVVSRCQPDSNLDNILLQLNNRTVWIIDRPLKHGDIFEETDPSLIQYLTKQYINSKQPLLVALQDQPGSSPLLAIELSIDNSIQEYRFQGGKRVWIRFTPTYSDVLILCICSNGLYVIPNDFSNYNSYESDAITQVDISNGNAQNYPSGSGPDIQERETWVVFLNYNYQVGQTYYVSFVLPFDAGYGLCIQGD